MQRLPIIPNSKWTCFIDLNVEDKNSTHDCCDTENNHMCMHIWACVCVCVSMYMNVCVFVSVCDVYIWVCVYTCMYVGMCYLVNGKHCAHDSYFKPFCFLYHFACSISLSTGKSVHWGQEGPCCPWYPELSLGYTKDTLSVFVISEEKNDGLHPGLPVFNLEIPFHIVSSYDQKEMQGFVSRADTVMFEIFMIMFPGWTSWSGIEVAELLRNHLPPCSVNLFHVAPFQCPVG